jgi:carboxypeptidase A1
MKLILLALFVVFFGSTLSKVSYRGDQVLRFNLTTQAQFNILQNLEEQNHVDVWSKHQGLSKIDIRIPTTSFEIVKSQLLEKFNIQYSVLVKDVQNLIDEETNQMKNRIKYDPKNKNTEEDFFKNFRTLAEIHAWLKEKAESSKLVSMVSAGKSYEGREMLGIKIAGGVNKPVTLHHGAIHAREWIAPTTVMYLANELITKYETDPTVKMLVDNLEWHIFPVMNVDGFVYTHTNTRLWRKTRRPNPGSTCVGTVRSFETFNTFFKDPNRNWGFKWNSGGSSSNPCSETYNGGKAWSEKCVENMKNYGVKLLPRLVGYIGSEFFYEIKK